MQEYARLGLPVAGQEVVAKRTLNSKTVDLGNGQYQLHQTMGIIHYNNNGMLEDIDLTPQDNGDSWVLTTAPYNVTIDKSIPQVSYKDATGLQIDLVLSSINNAVFNPIQSTLASHDLGHAILYSGLLGDGDLSIILTPTGIKTEQKIHSQAGIKTLFWNISQNQANPIITETAIRAQDANKAKVGVTIQRSPLTQNGGLWHGTFQEQCTGNLVALNKRTRAQSAGGAAAYPVTILS